MLAKELSRVPDREQVPETSTELTQDKPQQAVPMGMYYIILSTVEPEAEPRRTFAAPSESGMSSTNAMITRTIRAAIADIRQS